MGPNTSPTLLDRLFQGDRAAAESFAGAYRHLLFEYASRRLQPEDAEDVAQDVCLRFWQRPVQYDRTLGAGAFRRLLQVAVGRAAIDCLRKRVQKIAGVQREGLGEVPAPPELDFGEIEAARFSKATFKWAIDFIRNDFQPKTWNAFVRVRMNGESAEDVAADVAEDPALRMTANAIHVACNRVMKRLKEEVAGLDPRSFPSDSRN